MWGCPLPPRAPRPAQSSSGSTSTQRRWGRATRAESRLERASGRRVGREPLLVHCPRRLPGGKPLHPLTERPRALGGNARPALRKGLAFSARFVKAETHPTDWTTAEVVKTAENAYWDVQIAFANEVALISEELGVDAYRVRELVNTCPYRMMLIPGAGVGGHCIPKDSWLLVSPAVQSKPQRKARIASHSSPPTTHIVNSISKRSAVACGISRSWTVGTCTPAPTSSRWASCTEASEKDSSDAAR